jgi:hypothetical protein
VAIDVLGNSVPQPRRGIAVSAIRQIYQVGAAAYVVTAAGTLHLLVHTGAIFSPSPQQPLISNCVNGGIMQPSSETPPAGSTVLAATGGVSVRDAAALIAAIEARHAEELASSVGVLQGALLPLLRAKGDVADTERARARAAESEVEVLKVRLAAAEAAVMDAALLRERVRKAEARCVSGLHREMQLRKALSAAVVELERVDVQAAAAVTHLATATAPTQQQVDAPTGIANSTEPTTRADHTTLQGASPSKSRAPSTPPRATSQQSQQSGGGPSAAVDLLATPTAAVAEGGPLSPRRLIGASDSSMGTPQRGVAAVRGSPRALPAVAAVHGGTLPSHPMTPSRFPTVVPNVTPSQYARLHAHSAQQAPSLDAVAAGVEVRLARLKQQRLFLSEGNAAHAAEPVSAASAVFPTDSTILL